ncbi:S8 family serine peptidase [Bradyrhizobium sp. CB1015]|uniref:S8 family serine peptidase n=1 Tax=Bradyrhizobium sp. CB1015 TaxID=2976822 RepID=UPI0021AA3B72|nr:S8 family serine peptidase [Bradyrhizobium sp. CB1015]UWU95830.1 S8 family serine peptidase [Bradyrhizobium sp. CB1015]
MATSPDDPRPTSSGHQRKPVRTTQYIIAPAGPGVSAQTLAEQLNKFGNILWTHDQRGVSGPPIAIVRMPDEAAAALRRSAGGSLIIEPDNHLRAASFAGPASSLIPAAATMTALGPDLKVTIRVVSQAGTPLEQATVRLVGEQGSVQGRTDDDGSVVLTLQDEVPETIAAIFVSARSGHWGLWQQQPYVETDAVNTLTLKPLLLPGGLHWGGEAMRFDQIPNQCRGADVKVALIDSGVATSHKQLADINHGIDARGGEERSWSNDATGHGTPCAGIIRAAAQADHGIRGYAPDSELLVCKLPLDARCSDLIAALDDCLQNGIDVACVGVGCERGSVLVEQRIAMAKQQGVSIIAAAGNSGAGVLFPACSPHVLAVGAVGQMGSFPEDSPQAAQAAAASTAAGGLFVPPFSCRGSELDLCAPGVAVIACQSPDGYAVCDGTSLAAAHVAALAALILADHSDFKSSFIAKDVHRVERLFQILKETAQPVGHPWQTGAGLPDAARALGVWSERRPPALPLNAGLREMRSAIRRVNRVQFGASEAIIFEPPRGPANVTRLPLNPAPLAFQAAGGETATVHELRAAMALAGLAEGR